MNTCCGGDWICNIAINARHIDIKVRHEYMNFNRDISLEPAVSTAVICDVYTRVHMWCTDIQAETPHL